MPSVTCVIPTHNQHSGLLSCAIQSAIDAGVERVLVVVDRRQPFGDVPARCQFILSPGHGISAALNEGIRRATTERIAFLDSDDIWLHGKREQFDHPAPATFTDYLMAGEFVRCDRPLDGLWADNIPCRSTTVVDRELLLRTGGFDESLTYCQDWDMNCRIQALAGWTRVPSLLSRVADRPDGHTRSADHQARSACRAIVHRRWRNADRGEFPFMEPMQCQ